MGKVVMYSSVSVDGFIADENDQPGPLFEWLTSGDVFLDEVLLVALFAHEGVGFADDGRAMAMPRWRLPAGHWLSG